MSTPTPSEGLTLAAVAPIVDTRILVDTAEIFRPGPEVLDPDTGEYVPGPDTIMYQGSVRSSPKAGPAWSWSWKGRRTPTTPATGTGY
jgi:hypothetical protein